MYYTTRRTRVLRLQIIKQNDFHILLRMLLLLLFYIITRIKRRRKKEKTSNEAMKIMI